MPGRIETLLSFNEPFGPRLAFLLLVGVFACTRDSTPAGPLGASVDLRARLKPEIVSLMPADSAMVERVPNEHSRR
jgi:hypothetical protein